MNDSTSAVTRYTAQWSHGQGETIATTATFRKRLNDGFEDGNNDFFGATAPPGQSNVGQVAGGFAICTTIKRGSLGLGGVHGLEYAVFDNELDGTCGVNQDVLDAASPYN